jgi:hypothetical protein
VRRAAAWEFVMESGYATQVLFPRYLPGALRHVSEQHVPTAKDPPACMIQCRCKIFERLTREPRRRYGLPTGHNRNHQLAQWAARDGAVLELRAADLSAQFLTRV